MQHMSKYFGFSVKVSDFMEAEDFNLLKRRIAQYATWEAFDPNDYQIFLHQLVLFAKESHFGIGGGLPRRVRNILLKFSVNKKQRENRKIYFMNHVFEPNEHAMVIPAYRREELYYDIPSEYFVRNRYFQNVLVTFIQRGLPEKFRKIKIAISANATPDFSAVLKSRSCADAITNLDLPFSKAVLFKQQIELVFDHEEGGHEMSKTSNNQGTTNNFYVNQAGVVAPQSNVDRTNVSNQQRTIDAHLVKELRHLCAQIGGAKSDPNANAEIEIIEGAIPDIEAGRPYLQKLSKVSKWVLERADKIGLTLATKAIQDAIGM